MAEFNTNYNPQDFDAFKELHQIKSKEAKENGADSQISFDDLLELESDVDDPVAELDAHSAEVIHDNRKTLESPLNEPTISTEKNSSQKDQPAESFPKLLNIGTLINTAVKVKDLQSINDYLNIEIFAPQQSKFLKSDLELWDSILVNFKQSPDQQPIATIEKGSKSIRIRNARNVLQNLKDLAEIQYALVHHEHGKVFISDSLKADHPNIHEYAIQVDDDVAEHIQAKFQEAGFQPQVLVISNSRFNEFKTLATIYIQLKMQSQAENKKKDETSETPTKETARTQEPSKKDEKKTEKNREEISSKKRKYIQTIIFEEDIQRQSAEDAKHKKKERSERIKEKDQKIHERIKIAKENHDDVTSNIESEKIREEWKEE